MAFNLARARFRKRCTWFYTNNLETEDNDSDDESWLETLFEELTVERINTISKVLLFWAKKSRNPEKTLHKAIDYVLEYFRDDTISPEICARLFRRMAERAGDTFQSEEYLVNQGQQTDPFQLVQEYLSQRCVEDLEKGYAALDRASNSGGRALIWVLESIRLICALFGLQMVDMDTIHLCIEKLLGIMGRENDYEVFSTFASVLGKAGPFLDVIGPKARIESYFFHINELAARGNLDARSEIVLEVIRVLIFKVLETADTLIVQDLIELRGNQWIRRHSVTLPVCHVQEDEDDYLPPDVEPCQTTDVLLPHARALSRFGTIAKAVSLNLDEISGSTDTDKWSSNVNSQKTWRDLETREKVTVGQNASALITAKMIDENPNISYPEGIKGPKTEPPFSTIGGKFRYALSRH